MPNSIIAEPAATQGLRHDSTTIVLHWVTAVLVAALWLIGQTIDFAPSGPLRVDYRSLHIALGVTLGVVVVWRLAWRMTRTEALPDIDNGLLLLVARITHWGLYALLVVTIGLGIANVGVRGDSVFNLFTVPAYDPGNRALMHQVGGWHALAANTILIVAGIHAVAALFHHFVMRDATLRRMLPWQLR